MAPSHAFARSRPANEVATQAYVVRAPRPTDAMAPALKQAFKQPSVNRGDAVQTDLGRLMRLLNTVD